MRSFGNNNRAPDGSSYFHGVHPYAYPTPAPPLHHMGYGVPQEDPAPISFNNQGRKKKLKPSKYNGKATAKAIAHQIEGLDERISSPRTSGAAGVTGDPDARGAGPPREGEASTAVSFSTVDRELKLNHPISSTVMPPPPRPRPRPPPPSQSLLPPPTLPLPPGRPPGPLPKTLLPLSECTLLILT